MARIAQIPLGTAPYGTGRYAAMLNLTPEAISARFGLAFERVRDDLDDVDLVSIRTEAGVYAILGFYLNAPKKGIDVYIRDKAGDPRAELEDVLKSLEVTDADIIWTDFGK